jgi:serine phosphatase RsbU (regulator of sigma subunit)
MKACMTIISMHTLINQIQDSHHLEPHEFVSEINRKLCGDDLIQGEGGFVTLLYGFVENHVFKWTSAGHPLPLLQRLETNEFAELGDRRQDSGPPLGLMDEAVYTTIESPIPPGSRLLIYTDGLAEAFPDGPSPPEFGLEGIQAALARRRGESLTAAMAGLLEDSSEFTKGAGRHDDTSLLLLERRA